MRGGGASPAQVPSSVPERLTDVSFLCPQAYSGAHREASDEHGRDAVSSATAHQPSRPQTGAPPRHSARPPLRFSRCQCPHFPVPVACALSHWLSGPGGTKPWGDAFAECHYVLAAGDAAVCCLAAFQQWTPLPWLLSLLSPRSQLVRCLSDRVTPAGPLRPHLQSEPRPVLVCKGRRGALSASWATWSPSQLPALCRGAVNGSGAVLHTTRDTEF